MTMVTERRISHQLVHYWQQVKGDRILPPESDIDSDELAAQWDDCFHIHLHEGKGVADTSFSYSYVGSHLLPVFIEGRGDAAHLLSLPPEKLRAAYSEMQMTKLPVIESAEEYRVEGRYMKYRQCLLPLGTGKGEIQSIFGGMRYKYF